MNLINFFIFKWKDVAPERLQDIKLRCVFEFAEADLKAAEAAAAANSATAPAAVAAKSPINESIISANKTFEEAPTAIRQPAKVEVQQTSKEVPTSSSQPTTSSSTSSPVQTASYKTVNAEPIVSHKSSERISESESAEVKRLRQENEALRREIEQMKV